VLTPCKTIDDLASTGPTLEAILVELLYGNKAVDPVMAMARIKELEDRIAAMEAAAKPRPSSGQ
jgi:hypothetical protein